MFSKKDRSLISCGVHVGLCTHHSLSKQEMVVQISDALSFLLETVFISFKQYLHSYT